MNGLSYPIVPTDANNLYLYTGKELQEDFDLNWYDCGFRQLDPQLGRWFVQDALAESYMSTSPYAYAMNNPISNIDIAGLMSLQYEVFNIYPAAQTFFGGSTWDNMTFQSPIPCGGIGASGMGSGSTGKDYDTWYDLGGEKGTGKSFNDWYEEKHQRASLNGYLSVSDYLEHGHWEYRRKEFSQKTRYQTIENVDGTLIQILCDIEVIDESFWVEGVENSEDNGHKERLIDFDIYGDDKEALDGIGIAFTVVGYPFSLVHLAHEP
jgi:RHS repeat-associated protein